MAPTVDLNADLGEGDVVTASDFGVMEVVTSVSVACGFHAGSTSVMSATAEACRARHIAVGAHVSFRDRDGFGRRRMERSPEQLIDDILEQCDVLAACAADVGVHVRFVKPHGALYNQMAEELPTANAVVDAVLRSGIGALVAQPGTVVTARAGQRGLRVVTEAFPDRAYRPDGLLQPRSESGALIVDLAECANRAVSLARDHEIETADGSWTEIAVETLCIHGDAPDAAGRAGAIRQALVSQGVAVQPFVDP